MTKPVYGKQRTQTGAYSGATVERSTSRVAGDVPCSLTTRDKVRDATGGNPDLGTYPSDRPNYYVAGDGFKMGKRVPGIDDDDSSRALQAEWHRRAGFSGPVGRGTQHPSNSRKDSWPSRGTDSGGNAGPPRGAKFSWE